VARSKKSRTKIQSPIKACPQILIAGFIIGALSAFLYAQYGEWGIIPGLNMSQPSAAWARVVFFPGLAVGRWSYHNIFSSMFSLKTAIDCAGIVGILVMGLTGSLAAALITLRK